MEHSSLTSSLDHHDMMMKLLLIMSSAQNLIYLIVTPLVYNHSWYPILI